MLCTVERPWVRICTCLCTRRFTYDIWANVKKIDCEMIRVLIVIKLKMSTSCRCEAGNGFQRTQKSSSDRKIKAEKASISSLRALRIKQPATGVWPGHLYSTCNCQIIKKLKKSSSARESERTGEARRLGVKWRPNQP
jgi:hypothetical protein